MPLAISQYIQALASPVFRTLENAQVVPDSLIAGRNAAIFRLVTPRGERMLKCFLRPPQWSAEVYGYLSALRSPILRHIEWLPQELWVYDDRGSGAWADVALGEWIEGRTLEALIRQGLATKDTELLQRLADRFDTLVREMLRAEWAHGDLKPENIVVDADGCMTLIDYDAMFVPALAGRPSRELGTPPWQHPARDESFYDRHLDDYPITLLSVSLHALARWPELYAGGDCLLFAPHELVAGTAPVYKELLERWERLGEQRLVLLMRLLASPSPRLEELAQVMHIGSSATHYEQLEMFIERGKWGYRDAASGAVAIWPQYDRAFDFSYGLAAVRLGATWHFIDPMNRIVLNGAAWRQVKPFHEGLAAVQVGERWGYIDTAGRWVFEPQFDRGRNFCKERS